ncbi:CDP-glycerol glycerophosphotransferase family protein [Paenibacillus sp. P36]|uniref:CDP-glycerol glycerophosphotransferase family protein n=1 Tax=Paenibacillus sp. P36 TaxID=3342538 RepID=UPI0038B331A3
MMEKKIGFVIHNLVLFDTLKPLITELENQNIHYDILVSSIETEGWKEMAEDTYDHLLALGYNVKNLDSNPEKKYKIAFYPYLPYYLDLKTDYKIRYQYGMAKPTWNFSTKSTNFDWIFCNGIYDYSFLRAYTKCEISGFLKFANFKKKKRPNSEKPNILYLPTYGSACSIEQLQDVLKDLQRKYNLTIKLHHGTTFLEPHNKAIAEELTEKVFDHKYPLADLIQEADVILSDGSSAIFDAIVTDTPVVIFQPESAEPFEGFLPLEQQIIVDDIIPSTSNKDELEHAIYSALYEDKYADKRRSFKESNFPISAHETLNIVMNRIHKFLNDEIDTHFMASQRKVNSVIIEHESKIELLGKEVTIRDQWLQQQTEEVKRQIEEIKKRDEWLQQQAEEIKKRDEWLQQQAEEIKKRDQWLQQQTEEIQERKRQLQQQKQEIHQKDQIIQEQIEKINQKDYFLDEYNKELINRNQTIEQYSFYIDQIHNTISWKLSSKISKLKLFNFIKKKKGS